MKLTWVRYVAVLIGLVFVAGCSSNFRLSGFSVTVIDIRPINATLLETQASMTLRYTNENVIPVAISGSSHKLYLNGSYVGKAVSKEPVGLPSLNTVTQTVTVYLENLSLIQRLQAMAQGNNQVISYRLESQLYVEAGEDHDTTKTSSTGQLDLSAFSQATQR
jgi:LEA14-like dessication related protein